MIRNIFLFLLLLVFPSSVFSQTGSTTTLSGALAEVVPFTILSTNTSGASSGIFSLLDKRSGEQLKISETQASIDYETQSQAQYTATLKDLMRLKREIERLGGLFTVSDSWSLLVPESELSSFDTFFSDYKKLFPEQDNLAANPRVFQQNINTFLSDIISQQQELQVLLLESKIKLETHITELQNFENQLEKTQLSIQLQVFDGLKKAASFLALIFGTFLLNRFASHIIQKKSHAPEEKKKVILSLLSLIRNIIIIAIIIVFFFSELLNFLPFLAILGTAIWFALRDVISSFIAWFVIGLKDTTFKLGDVIEIPRDGIFWEVVKIHPLITTIKELGLSGPNSKFRTFPNKLIFETSLNNLWKYGGWTYIPIECMVTYESDIDIARGLLLDAMNEVCNSADFSHVMDQKARLKKLWIPEKNQNPQVFVDVRTQGVFLRWKMLVMWNERHEIRNRTVINFTQKMKHHPEVELRYVDFWVNELR